MNFFLSLLYGRYWPKKSKLPKKIGGNRIRSQNITCFMGNFTTNLDNLLQIHLLSAPVIFCMWVLTLFFWDNLFQYDISFTTVYNMPIFDNFLNLRYHARTTKVSNLLNPSFCSVSRLALYVYEYLLHAGATRAAQTFLSEVSPLLYPHHIHFLFNF